MSRKNEKVWELPFALFMTCLFAVFVVLYSNAQSKVKKIVEIKEVLQIMEPRTAEPARRLLRVGTKVELAFQGLHLVRAEAQELPAELVAGQLPFPHELFDIHLLNSQMLRHFVRRPQLLHRRFDPAYLIFS